MGYSEYTNDVPIDENGDEIKFIDFEYDLNDEIHTAQAKRRIEKKELALKIRQNSNLNIAELSQKYDISEYLIKNIL